MFIYSNTKEKVLTTYGSAIIFFCLHFWTVLECLKRESKTLTNKQRAEVRNYMNSENNTSWGWRDGWVSNVPVALALDSLGPRTRVRWLTHTTWAPEDLTPSHLLLASAGTVACTQSPTQTLTEIHNLKIKYFEKWQNSKIML